MGIRSLFHFWWLPVLSAIIWWCMLISLLSLWAVNGFPTVSWTGKPDQHILYISDIAAAKYFYQSIFIGCSATQGILFVISLGVEFYLRNVGWLRPSNRRYGQICSAAAIAFAVTGQLGILFVAIFNTRRFHDAHISLLVVFIVFVGISAFFSCAEYYALDRDYLHKRHMIFGFWTKAIWFIVEVALCIVFVSSQAHHKDVPAVFEWLISFVYPFYQLIIAWDLWPAIGKKKGHYPKYNESYPSDAYPIDPYPYQTYTRESFSGSMYPSDAESYTTRFESEGYPNTGDGYTSRPTGESYYTREKAREVSQQLRTPDIA